MGLLKQLHELKRSSEVFVRDQFEKNDKSGYLLQEQVEITPNEMPSEDVKENSFKITIIFGDWRLGDSVKNNGVFNPEDFQTIQNLKDAVKLIESPKSEMNGKTRAYAFEYLDYHENMITELKDNPPQFVLNLCDEGYQNNALRELHVPAYLEMLNIPYSGSGPTCLGVCYDKANTRAIAISQNVPVPEEVCVNPVMGDVIPEMEHFPRFIKPALGDNSIGITPGSVVYSQNALEDYVKSLFEQFPDRPVLIQEYLTGTEYSVGILGNAHTGFTHLPILEVDYSKLDPNLPPILGYESKFVPESPYWTQINYKKANLDAKLQKQLYRYAEKLAERCGCRDYARFDFRADAKGVVKMLEVNPNPGWCWDGKLNKMARFNGWSYSELIGSIIYEARKRYNLL